MVQLGSSSCLYNSTVKVSHYSVNQKERGGEGEEMNLDHILEYKYLTYFYFEPIFFLPISELI